MMDRPSFTEEHISQLPALLMLIKLGYRYLSPQQAMQERGQRTANALLENILFRKLKEMNRIRYKGQEHSFSDTNLRVAIDALKKLHVKEGLMNANKKLYDLISLGKSLEQTIAGDRKSFQLRYIDWHCPENNVFHVTEEFSVKRNGSDKEYRPVLVLFVNGIPFVIITVRATLVGFDKSLVRRRKQAFVIRCPSNAIAVDNDG